MADLAKLLSSRVPRYTSYPTAVQFHGGVDGDTHARWLSELPADMALSLYLHVPFCKQLCWFCGCHTHVANTYNPVHAYAELLKTELAQCGTAVGTRREVSHIHWGGGSPTILKPSDFLQLMREIEQQFQVRRDAEIAVEVDPRTLSAELVEAFRLSGVNRASLGVQDCDPAVLKAVNRMQTPETTHRAVDALREAGVPSINIDLMYGLPHQTVDGVKRTIDEVLTLKPDRLAIFGYAHLPSFKAQQALIDEAALPDLQQRLDQYEAGRKHLIDHGYIAIGLDHFAAPNDAMAKSFAARTLFRNFQGYTTDASPALVGIGSSAISALPQGYTQNAVPMPAYRKAVLSGAFATSRGVALSAEDNVRRAIISDLMCYGDADTAAIAQLFGGNADKFAEELDTLQPLVREGLVIRSGYRITVPPEFHVAIRVVCAAFDSYLTPQANRHATAV